MPEIPFIERQIKNGAGTRRSCIPVFLIRKTCIGKCGSNGENLKKIIRLNVQFWAPQVSTSHSPKFLSQDDPEKFNTTCFASQTYFVASDLRPTVVFNFVFKWPRGSHSRLPPRVSF